ncbi:MAG: hypothetical protein LBI60_07030, partial [Bacteroidales bacterium]|nr:hypothetical protein [Bacteroidales bacterium]
MRNFVLFFLMGAFGIFAKAQNDFTVSWLSVDTSLTGYGSGSTSTITAFMEFDLTDLTNYKSVAITLDTVKQVQFYIEPDYRNSITACNVVIRQGSSIGAGTDMVVQSVPTTILVGKWNNIDLDTFYTIDPTKKLYIGYQLSFTASTSVPAYPFSTASNTNPKQGWIKSGDNYRNLINDVGYALGFLIKAVVTSAKPLLAEIVLTSLDIEQYNIIGDSLLIKGTIEYLGPTPLTSFNLVYTLDGVSSTVDTITGLNIATNTSYTF